MYTTDCFLKKGSEAASISEIQFIEQLHLVLFRFVLNVFIYLKERERERGKRNVNVVVSCMSPTGNQICNPGNVPRPGTESATF